MFKVSKSKFRDAIELIRVGVSTRWAPRTARVSQANGVAALLAWTDDSFARVVLDRDASGQDAYVDLDWEQLRDSVRLFPRQGYVTCHINDCLKAQGKAMDLWLPARLDDREQSGPCDPCDKWQARFDTRAVASAVRRVMWSLSPADGTMQITFEDEDVRFAATDRYTLAVERVHAEIDKDAELELVIPSRAIAVLPLLQRTGEVADVYYGDHNNEDWMTLTTQEASYTCRLPRRYYPSWENLSLDITEPDTTVCFDGRMWEPVLKGLKPPRDGIAAFYIEPGNVAREVWCVPFFYDGAVRLQTMEVCGTSMWIALNVHKLSAMAGAVAAPLKMSVEKSDGIVIFETSPESRWIAAFATANMGDVLLQKAQNVLEQYRGTTSNGG